MIVTQSLFKWSINKKNGFLSLSFVNFHEIKCPKFVIFCKIAKINAREIFVFQIREIKCLRKLVRIRYPVDSVIQPLNNWALYYIVPYSTVLFCTVLYFILLKAFVPLLALIHVAPNSYIALASTSIPIYSYTTLLNIRVPSALNWAPYLCCSGFYGS